MSSSNIASTIASTVQDATKSTLETAGNVASSAIQSSGNVASSAISATGDFAKTTLDAAVGMSKGATQLIHKDDNFSLRPYNQVMLVYILIIIIMGLWGLSGFKLFNFKMNLSLEQVSGASLGILVGMIICKFLWIIFGRQYVKTKEKEGYFDDDEE